MKAKGETIKRKFDKHDYKKGRTTNQENHQK